VGQVVEAGIRDKALETSKEVAILMKDHNLWYGG